MNTLQAGLSVVRKRFAACLPERAAVIDSLRQELEDDPDAYRFPSMNAAKINLHRIAGTAGTLGFSNLGDMSRQAEDLIVAYADGAQINFAELHEKLQRVLKLIDQVYNSLPDTETGAA
ncbi:Hpt domain-containing protein [Pseudoruegeria sp. HB172150]|uniref:Hpt domain-containing protein n=1 Tax=Pseudoruegeria sp. HB172150 TaxID=2721164 RepID=UPI00155628F6|nr:Hpt domain-containing protein [Pseudoruegeria sp. HB172150]